jgi:uncharacterized protein YmfQ (DUF2313 family)
MTNGIVPSPPQSPTQIPSPLFSAIPPSIPFDRHIRRGQEEYAHALSALLPRGIAWPRWPDTVIMKFVYGVAGVMGWADGRAADLLEIESDPRTTTEMLDSWEKAWGLPDPCFKTSQSVGERRKILVMRMTLLGAQSREFFIGIANYLGYQVSITEYRPFMVGVDACGDNRLLKGGLLGDWPCQIGDPAMRFAWTVHVEQTKLVWFRAGSGQAGIDPHLRIARDNDLECILHRWGPAHTLSLFDYSGIDDPFAGADRYNVMLRDGEPVTLRDGTTIIDTRPITIYWPQAPNAFYVGSPTFVSPILVVARAIPDPSTQAWMSVVITRGGVISPTYQTVIDLLIKGLKADGLWPLYDRIWYFGAERDAAPDGSIREIAALTDLVQGAVATNVSSSFTPIRGYSGAYVDSNFNPTTPGSKYTRNNSFAAIWSLDLFNPIANNLSFGMKGGAGRTYIDVQDYTNPLDVRTYFAINDTFGLNANFSVQDDFGYGLYAMNRSASTLSQAFRNGRQVQFSNDGSQALENSTFTFCGAAGYSSVNRVAVGVIGASHTVDQQAQLYARLSAAMRAMGAI